MDAKHTATPWNYLRSSTSDRPIITAENEPLDIAALSVRDKGVQVAYANAAFIVRACNAHDDLVSALSRAIEHAGFSISGPTDVRAVEHGEPTWVCNARAALAKACAV